MIAGSKTKQPQVTGDVLRASGAMLLSHLATHPSAVPLGLTLRPHRGRRRGFQFCCTVDKMTAVDRATDPQLQRYAQFRDPGERWLRTCLK